MDEECKMYILRGPVVCIETGEDRPKRIYLSQVPDKPSPISEIRRRAEAIEAAANIAASGMFLTAGIGMLYLVIRMGYGIVW